MKKLSRKGKVHPITYDDCLSFLPPTILALTVVLSPEDKLVLAYLISCSSSTTAFASPSDSAAACGGGCIGNEISKNRVIDHATCFNCNCFSCYMSYWVKWDASPNRQVIHDIIDVFEQDSSSSSTLLLKKNKKEKHRRKRSKGSTNDLSNIRMMNRVEKEDEVSESVYVHEVKLSSINGGSNVEKVADGGGELLQVEDTNQKSSVKSVLSFLGGKFWTLLLI